MDVLSKKPAAGWKRVEGLADAALVPLSFFMVDCFACYKLSLDLNHFVLGQLWPLVFGAVWALLISCLLRLLPAVAARICYGVLYFGAVVYAGFQTGYYILFSEMMWLSDFRYTSEGVGYADILLTYPLKWWLGLAFLIAVGVLMIWKFPQKRRSKGRRIAAGLMALAMSVTAYFLPQAVFCNDDAFVKSDFGRMESAEAAYENMFNAHRLYQVCGLTQTAIKDVYTHFLYPLTPGYAEAREAGGEVIREEFAQYPQRTENRLTGALKGKNVILVLMESMDDWMIGEHTPTLVRLMEEGINFTRFYTPVYGGIRTFNTEFCINTGSFLGSSGGYAFDYVNNSFPQSLPSVMRQAGYTAKTFHYNEPSFYSRGVFSETMGYEKYVCYQDYIGREDEWDYDKLYDELFLFEDPELSEEFFRQGKPRLNFVITRSAHLSYKYNEVLSYWALKRYPGYRGLTGSEETDCAYLKARLVDDFFARLLWELEARGELENTVIVGVTDHYTYGYKNEAELLKLSGVDEQILLERTPCFIWSPGLEAMEVDKIANTSDLLPTVLNLLDMDSQFPYIGRDIFDDSYPGWVPFSNGSWIFGNTVYDAPSGRYLSLEDGAILTKDEQDAVHKAVARFIKLNNLILETDFYRP